MFNVHSKLAIRLSPVFCALINGGMIESRERVASLGDIDEDTFGRFCEYAYTENFSVPAPRTVGERSISPESQSQLSEVKGCTSSSADKQPITARKFEVSEPQIFHWQVCTK